MITLKMTVSDIHVAPRVPQTTTDDSNAFVYAGLNAQKL